jgi:hypothetical protein
MPLKCSRGKSNLSVINRRCHQIKEARGSRESCVRAINLHQFLVLVLSLPFSFVNASLLNKQVSKQRVFVYLSIVFLNFPLLFKIEHLYMIKRIMKWKQRDAMTVASWIYKALWDTGKRSQINYLCWQDESSESLKIGVDWIKRKNTTYV